MASSPIFNTHSGFSIDHSTRGAQLSFSAIGGKPIKLSLMSEMQMGNLAMADFSSAQLQLLPLLQPLVLRTSFIIRMVLLLINYSSSSVFVLLQLSSSF